MKKLVLAIILFATLNAQGQLFTFSFTGTGACPTQSNAPVLQPANATVSEVTRVNLTCQTYSDWFNSSAWNLGGSIDLTEYLEVTITANAGYVISAASLNANFAKSATGPGNIRIAHDGGSGTFSAQDEFTLTSTSSTSHSWDFADFSSPTSGVIKFRIYGWNATGGTGTLRIDDLTVNGAVTLAGSGNSGNTPFSFDLNNNFVGLGKIPTQKLDIIGNIRTEGKLLIGNISDAKVTALADYSLAVDGQALFTKARVLATTNWPDYVFEDKYALMSLDKVEKYIIKYKHLPGMVSAGEVAVSGIDIASTQAALLQKVEELTLYIINQDKRIQTLQSEIQGLKKKK